LSTFSTFGGLIIPEDKVNEQGPCSQGAEGPVGDEENDQINA
jgi:hypothetical protein